MYKQPTDREFYTSMVSSLLEILNKWDYRFELDQIAPSIYLHFEF